MKPNFTVRERGNSGYHPSDENLDRIYSRHRTRSGAQRVVDQAERRAKARFGSTGYTTLYVYAERIVLHREGRKNDAGGSTGANQYAAEWYRGEYGGKPFAVFIKSTDAPAWEGDLDQDERDEVMERISEVSAL